MSAPSPVRVLIFPVESPAERAAHSLACAIEDIDAAIWQAKTQKDLVFLRDLANEQIRKLEASATTAATLDERFDDMRRTR